MDRASESGGNRGPSYAATRPRRGVADIIAWLVGDECHDLDIAGLLSGLGERLLAQGLPLNRLVLHLRTLHPEILGCTFAWSPHELIETYDREHQLEESGAFRGSAVRRVMDSGEWLSVRVEDSIFPHAPIVDVFRGHGLAELVIAPLVSRTGPASAVSFCTRQRSGFRTADRDLLAQIVPALRGACELKILHQAETTLLDTYVGIGTGRRILAGHIRRGDVETLEAALMVCDLRGFTALANRLAPQRILQLLDLYFDQIVPAISENGGEVLKYIGDAVLAFFPRRESEGASCSAALQAARVALSRLAHVCLPDAKLQAGIALHYGKVSYGNIGAGRRLDFTVIGPDVNLTSRIASVCAQRRKSLLTSPEFANLLASKWLVSIGRHQMKGFPEPVNLFEWIDSAPRE